jgi:hypothetical protein
MPVTLLSGLEQRLERGEVVVYPTCPFPLPEGEERRLLLEQELGKGHKNISYHPHTGRVRGFRPGSAQGASPGAERLRDVLAGFSRSVTTWLGQVVPRYGQAWQMDQVSFRPLEESTRQLRLTARNDLLHVDAFPNRPTNGWRILRVFANINPTQPRVWMTAQPFAQLLERYAHVVGLPSEREHSCWQRLYEGALSLFVPARRRRSPYDRFMLRLHDFLKANEQFQRDCPKQHWEFPPGSAWLAMTDTCSHAVLRGRYALEHSYFIAPQSLALPEKSPAALLERASGVVVLNQ